jgi:hypothetical protein
MKIRPPFSVPVPASLSTGATFTQDKAESLKRISQRIRTRHECVHSPKHSGLALLGHRFFDSPGEGLRAS